MTKDNHIAYTKKLRRAGASASANNIASMPSMPAIMPYGRVHKELFGQVWQRQGAQCVKDPTKNNTKNTPKQQWRQCKFSATAPDMHSICTVDGASSMQVQCTGTQTAPATVQFGCKLGAVALKLHRCRCKFGAISVQLRSNCTVDGACWVKMHQPCTEHAPRPVQFECTCTETAPQMHRRRCSFSANAPNLHRNCTEPVHFECNCTQYAPKLHRRRCNFNEPPLTQHENGDARTHNVDRELVGLANLFAITQQHTSYPSIVMTAHA